MKDGRIVAVGSRAGVETARRGEATRLVDPGGKALLPGFLDAGLESTPVEAWAGHDRGPGGWKH